MSHHDHVCGLGEGGDAPNRRDHVRPKMAEFRPDSGKTTSCGGTGLPGATRSGLGWAGRRGGATGGRYWLRTLRRRRITRVRAGHRRRAVDGKLRINDGVLLFIARRRACGVDNTRANLPRRFGRVTARESGENRSAVNSAWRRRQAVRCRSIFLKNLQNCHCVHFSNYSQIF